MDEIVDHKSTLVGNMSTGVVAELERRKIIAILRGDLKGREQEIAQTLLAAGITVIEVTLNSPNALQNIRIIRNKISASLFIGAGTVLAREEVKKAHDAGAQFIVSPNLSPDVVQATKERGMASFPGCSTCTEILQAVDQGADGVKVFPATTLQPEGLRAILAALGPLRLVPTGGVTKDNAAKYFASGAWALGVGNALVNDESVDDLEKLRLRSKAFAAIGDGEQG